jgi:hypothetical protein
MHWTYNTTAVRRENKGRAPFSFARMAPGAYTSPRMCAFERVAAMRIEQAIFTASGAWEPERPGRLGREARLVLVFAARNLLGDDRLRGELAGLYPAAQLVGCSTAGEIFRTKIFDDTAVVTAIGFDRTDVRVVCTHKQPAESSWEIGRRLAEMLPPESLAHVFVLSDGLVVNGSDLVSGLMQKLPDSVNITGGMAADGDRFESTLILADGAAREHRAAAVGFYGSALKVGFGSMGGWDPFGPLRRITRSLDNVLYEFDGKSALELYKRYLGDYAKDLPASGLLFPLLVTTSDGDPGVVRTIRSVNEADQSLTFAGDVPQGALCRLMKANFDRLIDGATAAARINRESGQEPPELAILISCFGRKMVLKQRTEEEVEAVRDVLGERTTFSGFYSYGEISPLKPGTTCDLHNQTMTITTLSEG